MLAARRENSTFGWGPLAAWGKSLDGAAGKSKARIDGRRPKAVSVRHHVCCGRDSARGLLEPDGPEHLERRVGITAVEVEESLQRPILPLHHHVDLPVRDGLDASRAHQTASGSVWLMYG